MRKILSKWFLPVFFLAVLSRVLFLSEVPLRVDGDASRFGLDGVAAWKDHWQFFSTGWYGHSNALMYFIGLFVNSFRDNLLGLRLFSAVGGILGIWATYLLAKKMFGERIACWSALFLAVCPFHIVVSRVGTEAVWMSFFAPMSAYLILGNSRKYDLLAGVAIGISQYFYPGARILPVTTTFLLVTMLVCKEKNTNQTIKTGILIVLGLLLVYLPMVRYFYFHKSEYFARVSIVGVFQSGWLKNEAKTRPLQQVVMQKLVDSYKVFWLPVKSGAKFWFFRTPYLDTVPAILSLIGIVGAVISIRKYQSQYLILFFLTTVFFAGVLTVDSPTPSRYVIIFPTIAIFVGLGVDRLARIFLNQKLIAVLLTFVVLGSAYSYWKHETTDVWNHDINTQTATFSGRYLSKISRKYTIYFLSEFYMYYDSVPTLRFLTRKRGIDVAGHLEKEKDKLDFGEDYIFLVLPSRGREMSLLKKINPRGYEKIIYNPREEVLCYLFSSFPLY